MAESINLEAFLVLERGGLGWALKLNNHTNVLKTFFTPQKTPIPKKRVYQTLKNLERAWQTNEKKLRASCEFVQMVHFAATFSWQDLETNSKVNDGIMQILLHFRLYFSKAATLTKGFLLGPFWVVIKRYRNHPQREMYDLIKLLISQHKKVGLPRSGH